MSKHIHVHLDIEREPNQSDLNAAAKGLNMLGMRPSELEDLIKLHEGKPAFASKATLAAAKQMLASKRRMGAKDSVAGAEKDDAIDEADMLLSLILRSLNGIKNVAHNLNSRIVDNPNDKISLQALKRISEKVLDI